MLQQADLRGAIKEFERAIKADASLLESHWLRALTLTQAGRAREAETVLAGLRRRHRDNADICHAHSEALLRLGRGEEMCRAVDDGLLLNPGHFSLVQQKVHAARFAGNYTEAVAYALRAFALQPNLAAARLEVGLLLMLTGSVREALPFYEARHYSGRHPGRRWLGEATDQALTILAEQGLGDVLQACRYYPAVAALAPAVEFHVHKSLRGLIARSFPDLKIVAGYDTVPQTPQHAWCMDLPGFFEGIVKPVPRYLQADPARCDAWEKRLPADGVKVGLAWQGNPDFRHDGFRSLPLARFAPLADVAHLHLVSLRIESPPRNAPVPLLDFSRDLRDFEDTAALVENLDLVITTDTSVAHLAGALGKECWVLLQRPYDWRWGIEGEESALYPNTRLLRDAAMTDVRGRLLKRFGDRLT